MNNLKDFDIIPLMAYGLLGLWGCYLPNSILHVVC